MALSNITVCLKKMTSSFVPSQCSFLCASCGLQNPFYRVALTELSMKGFSFLCSVLCMLVQKKNFHSQKVSEYKQLLFSIYHIIKTKRQKWVQVALSLWSYWYSFPPPISNWKWCTTSKSHCRITDPGTHLTTFLWWVQDDIVSFTFEVTLGDNEVGGPFHLHAVSLITVCQLLVWPCMSAH